MVRIRPPGSDTVRTPSSVRKVGEVMRSYFSSAGNFGFRKRMSWLNDNIALSVHEISAGEVLLRILMRWNRTVTHILETILFTTTRFAEEILLCGKWVGRTYGAYEMTMRTIDTIYGSGRMKTDSRDFSCGGENRILR